MARIFRRFTRLRKEKAMIVRSRAALVMMSAFILVLRAPQGAAQSLSATPTATQIAPNVTATQVQQPQVGPTFDALTVGVRHVAPATTQAQQRGGAGLGQNEALMIVGGAAILVGAIVEGDAGKIFMIGGAIVGLYGLYKYLQ
jgi:hypothetical protein